MNQDLYAFSSDSADSVELAAGRVDSTRGAASRGYYEGFLLLLTVCCACFLCPGVISGDGIEGASGASRVCRALRMDRRFLWVIEA
jgi:hypothetical protein